MRLNIAYILSDRIRLEFTYAAQFTRPNGDGLEYTDNIFRLNIKVGLAAVDQVAAGVAEKARVRHRATLRKGR